MPRSYKLTWQPHAKGSGGRWKKKYRGKVHYFEGTTKSDVASYKAAEARWEKLKIELDSNAEPSPLQIEYAAAIREWEGVAAWSVAHDDQTFAALARGKLEELRDRAERPSPPPLTHWDRFRSHVRLEPPSEILDQLAAVARQPVVLPDPADAKAAATFFAPPSAEWTAQESERRNRFISELDGSPGRIRAEIWRDRLEVASRTAPDPEENVAFQVERFLKLRRDDVAIGKLSAGRADLLRLHFETFRDWYGPTNSVKLISPRTVEAYFEHISRRIRDGEITAVYGANLFAAFRRFVRWVYDRGVIDATPRNLDRRDYRFPTAPPAVQTCTITEVNRLLAEATDRTKLYFLLMLNCGLTQKDISDLTVADVDFDGGAIVRKRSKTRDHANVPTVRYRLWPETLRLLKQECSKSGDRVLVNRDGGPLKFEELRGETLIKIDNVNSAYDRLRRRLKFAKPLKALKKTSASLIRDHKSYTSLESLFLGHASRSVAHRHYAKEPQTLLDEAIAWLGRQYQTAPKSGGRETAGRATRPRAKKSRRA